MEMQRLKSINNNNKQRQHVDATFEVHELYVSNEINITFPSAERNIQVRNDNGHQCQTTQQKTDPTRKPSENTNDTCGQPRLAKGKKYTIMK